MTASIDFTQTIAVGALVRFGRGTGFAYGRVHKVTPKGVAVRPVLSGSGIKYPPNQPVSKLGSRGGVPWQIAQPGEPAFVSFRKGGTDHWTWILAEQGK